MCGIAGIANLNRKSSRADTDILEAMVSVQRHRGPDDIGIFQSESVGLGHARLSVIDLSKDGHQPMSNEDAAIHVIHNGEIYNYLELKTELERLGHHFRSKTDTEVIVHAYEEWGEHCPKYFNGMWAFAVLDLKMNVLFCSRDRFGVKPFYYYKDDDCFVFASEIKAILRHPRVKREPNGRTIYNYLASGYGYMDVSDETFFYGIKQLRAAHNIKLSFRKNDLSQKRYWDIDPHRKTEFKEEKEAYGRFRELFRDSVRLRLRSDVPVGVALSGGLDSSSIACVASQLLGNKDIETFSSCFDEEKYDERRFIVPVLREIKAKENFVFTKSEQIFDAMDEIIWHQEEPYSTLSIFPQWFIMRLARQKGVKVLLTGQGGDEVLGGYHKYYFYLFADLIWSFRYKDAMREIDIFKKVKGDNGLANQILKIILSKIVPKFLKKYLKGAAGKPPSYLNRSFANRYHADIPIESRFDSILNNDLYNALKVSPLPSLLHIDDRSSMAHSVESRAPFLDYRLVEYLFSLGPEYKIKNGITKYILRQSMTGVLPEEVRTRTDKMGFATPLEKWLKGAIKDKVYEILTSREFSGRPYFNSQEALKKFENFVGRGESTNGHYAIWSWVNLELWLRKFIDAR